MYMKHWLWIVILVGMIYEQWVVVFMFLTCHLISQMLISVKCRVSLISHLCDWKLACQVASAFSFRSSILPVLYANTILWLCASRCISITMQLKLELIIITKYSWFRVVLLPTISLHTSERNEQEVTWGYSAWTFQLMQQKSCSVKEVLIDSFWEEVFSLTIQIILFLLNWLFWRSDYNTSCEKDTHTICMLVQRLHI